MMQERGISVQEVARRTGRGRLPQLHRDLRIRRGGASDVSRERTTARYA